MRFRKLASPLRLSGVGAVAELPGYGSVAHCGETVPADGGLGFAHGCLFINVSGTDVADSVYVNQGDSDSAAFAQLGGAGNLDAVGAMFLAENSSAAAAANRRALQAAIDAGAPINSWQFRGASADSLNYYVDSTIKVTGGGRKWQGLGKTIASSAADFSSRLLIRADTSGQTVTTTASGATATLTNRTVVASDLYNSVELDTGWFTIVGVNTTANTWTLDRTCTNGGLNLTPSGFYCPELLQLASHGETFDGINFIGALSGYTHNGRIGCHVLTGEQTSSTPTGKHRFSSCTWQNFDYPILLGPGMAKFGESLDGWVGYTDSYADNMYFSDIWIENAKDCITTRCDQAVVHRIFGMRAESVTSSIFRIDAGGKLSASGLEVSGASGTQCLVKLGPHSALGTDGPVTIRDFSFDGGASTYRPQLLVTDFPVGAAHRSINIKFDSGIINRKPGETSGYLVDVESAVYATFEDIQYGNYGFTDNTVKIVSEGGAWKPDLTFRNVNMAVTDLEDVVDLTNSTGGTVSFENCLAGGVRKPDGVYMVDSAGVGHWAYQEAFA